MRPLITAATLGWVYLLHFGRPIGNLANPRAQAQHYVGFATDLEERVAQQLAGIGARITQAAVAQGVEISLVAAWQAPLAFEKHVKRIKNAPRLCPVCCRQHGRRARHVEPMIEQLTLGLEVAEAPAEDWIEPSDLPSVPNQPDWLEITYMRRWAAARVPLPIDVPDELI